MNLLDPKLGGKLRAIGVILTFVVVVLTDPRFVDLGWTWVTPVVAGINGVIQLLAHFTTVGDASTDGS